ncbi:hypothetical protein DERF_005049 [Dermatophagoides farinae]|uniref:Uncharacterized protein n=1 Tax=Dermatophagoides farinae TaxID=6954 RepID=A0A922I4I5_DERFA|nr:hypothetical protein DERF_005049 [Dermatophagoides farinae]
MRMIKAVPARDLCMCIGMLSITVKQKLMIQEKRFNNVVTVLGRGCLREPPWCEPRAYHCSFARIAIVFINTTSSLINSIGEMQFLRAMSNLYRGSFIKGQSNFRWWTLCSIVHIGNSHHHDDTIFSRYLPIGHAGKRHRKPFVDTWGKLLTSSTSDAAVDMEPYLSSM